MAVTDSFVLINPLCGAATISPKAAIKSVAEINKNSPRSHVMLHVLNFP